jgi:hypothetical protein
LRGLVRFRGRICGGTLSCMTVDQTADQTVDQTADLTVDLKRRWVLGPVVFGLSALPLTVAGRRSRVVAIRRTWLGIGGTPDRPTPVPLMLPLATVSFVLVVVALLTVYTGELYPLRPDTIGHLDGMFTGFPGGDQAWGGPTLAGAWLVHALIGIAIQIVALACVRGLAILSARGRRDARAR